MKEIDQNTINNYKANIEQAVSNKDEWFVTFMTDYNPTGTGREDREPTEIENIRTAAVATEAEYMAQSFEIKKSLQQNLPAHNSKERKDLVFDLLYALFVSNMGKIYKENREAVAVADYESVLDEIHDRVYDGEGEKLRGDKWLNIGYKDVLDSFAANTIGDFEVVLATAGNKEEIKEAFRESIENLEEYKNLVKVDANHLTAALMEADEAAKNGITSLEAEYDIYDDAAKEYNDASIKDYEDSIKSVEEKIYEVAVKDRYNVNDYGRDSFDLLVKQINGYQELLVNNTNKYRGSSKNYNDFKAAIDRLAEYSQKLADAGMTPSSMQMQEYLELAREADRLGGHYITNKTKINSDYARARVDGVNDIRLKLQANISGIEKQLSNLKKQEDFDKNLNDENMKKDEKATNDRFKHHKDYSLEQEKVYSVYRGNKYNDAMLEQVKGSYSLHRTAGYSITMMALAAQVDEVTGKPKYTFEELINPDKIKEAKALMFDKVITTISKTAEEGPDKKAANEWLAKQMYEGHKVTVNMIDEQLKNIDLNNDNFVNTPEFAKVMAMGAAQFDVAQEVAHCSKEVIALASKDNPDIKTIVDYQNESAKDDGVFGQMNTNISLTMIQLKNLDRAKKEKKEFGDHVNLFTNALEFKFHKDMLKEWKQKTDGNVPFSKWHKETDAWKRTQNVTQLKGIVMPKVWEMKFEVFDDLSTELVNGNLLSEAKFVLKDDQPEIEGIPQLDAFESDYHAKRMDENIIKENCKLVYAGLKEKYDNTKANEKDMKEYITNAMDAVNTLSENLLKKTYLTPDIKNLQIKNCVDAIVALSWAEKHYDSHKNGVGLREAVRKSMELDEAYKKDMQYIGTGTLLKYAFNNEAEKFTNNEIIAKAADYHAEKMVIIARIFGKEMNRDALISKITEQNDPEALRQLIAYDYACKVMDDIAEGRQEEELIKFTPKQYSKIKAVTVSINQTILSDLKNELKENPQYVNDVYDKYNRGELINNIEYNYETDKVTFPNLNEIIKEKNSIMKINADNKLAKAMERLEKAKYKNTKEYIKDAATVTAVKIYNETGKMPINPSTNKEYSVNGYIAVLESSLEFRSSLKSKAGGGKFINPKAFAKNIKNPAVIKNIVKTAVDRNKNKAEERKKEQVKNNNKASGKKRANSVTNR